MSNFRSRQILPTPLNPAWAAVEFELPLDADISLSIIDQSGQEVEAILDHRTYTAGTHTVEFPLARFRNGVHFYRLVAQSDETPYVDTKRIII